ncbi:MAG TPA: DUF5343 domain-containing protein [Balneolaceae bacterium]|nr:DUF5343 domain-containing protein [Balneolaceae bacterium]
MGVSEAFLVNTKNFDTIISALAAFDSSNINTELIQNLGYSDPNDLLVVHLLKDFRVINDDGSPAKYFDEFQNPKTTKRAVAGGLLEAYSSLFERHPSIHHAPPEKVKEAFAELFGDKKTDLIIKYITGTFLCVASYCGTATIDAMQKAEVFELDSTVKSNQNGFHKNGISPVEEIGTNTIDDLVNDFNFQQKPVKNNNEIKMPEKMAENGIEKEDKSNSLNGNYKNPGTNLTMENSDYNIDHSFDLNGALPEERKSLSLNNHSNKAEFIQKALFRKSDLLYKLQRWENLLPTLEEIIKRYDKPEYEGLQEKVSRCIIHRAIVLLKLNRLNDALPALDSVIQHFENSDNKEFYQKATMAMIFKVQILEPDEDSRLLPLYNAIIERADSNSTEVMKDKLDQIHLKRFDLILATGETANILDASSELIERFRDSQKHSEYLQKAMIQRAQILDEMNRDEDALEAYDEFLAAFA